MDMDGRGAIEDLFTGRNHLFVIIESLIRTDRECLELEQCPVEFGRP
jgi:hypothetical protein